jgi:hypothetical protein
MTKVMRFTRANSVELLVTLEILFSVVASFASQNNAVKWYLWSRRTIVVIRKLSLVHQES